VSRPDLRTDGKTLAVSDYPGTVVVLNYWGQWCGPCRAEAPELEKVFEIDPAFGSAIPGDRHPGSAKPRRVIS
jgi:peroxiredoxin